MLRGRLGNTSKAPYLEGQLAIPRLGVKALISFLVDTGADESLLMPADGIRMGVAYSKLRPPKSYLGIGGNTRIHSERALLTFADLHSSFTYNVRIGIAAKIPELMTAPSLLGRDVINHWRMTYDPQKGVVNFKVISADFTHKI